MNHTDRDDRAVRTLTIGDALGESISVGDVDEDVRGAELESLFAFEGNRVDRDYVRRRGVRRPWTALMPTPQCP